MYEPIYRSRGTALSNDEIDANTRGLALDGASQTRNFSPVLLFDRRWQLMQTSITADTTFSLATNGNVNDATAVVEVVSNGTATVLFASGIFVYGAFQSDAGYVNVLTFYRCTARSGVVCHITSYPLPGYVPAGDTTAPQLQSAVVSNAQPTRIVLTYSEALQTGLLVASDFVASGGRTITSLALSGATITLTVNTAYANGDTITVSGGGGHIRDASGNVSPNLSYQGVTNGVQPPATTDQVSVRFSDAGQVMTPANQASLIAALQGAFSLVFRVTLESTTGKVVIIALGTFASPYARSVDVAYQYNNSPGIQRIAVEVAFVDVNGNYMLARTTAQNLGTSEHWFALTYDGSATTAGIKLYTDNVLGVEVTDSYAGGQGTAFNGQYASGHSLRYGQVVDQVSHEGRLQSLEIFAGALAPAQLNEIYPTRPTAISFANQSKARYGFESNMTDASGNNHDATASNQQYI